MRRALVLAFAIACGPKPAPIAVPRLPGDGDANVAKPPAVAPRPAADNPWAGKTDLIAPPAPAAPAKLELPVIEEVKLANGLDVFMIKNDHLPVVSMQLAIRAGRMDEPRARLGVAEATADMLVKGTAKRDALGLAKAIDFVGGTIAADATFEATLVSCSVLARNLPTCLELVPEMVMQPSFSADELVKVQDAMVGAVRQRHDDAGALASEHVQNLLWGNDHVRGWINSEQSVRALRRDDLVAWHKAWFVPNNAMLVVAGDIDPKKLKSDLERAFGGWKKGTVPPVPSYHEPGLSGIRIRLVDKPGQTQTHIRVAQFGISHKDPRFFDMLVWNHVLGSGDFTSRLMKTVRVAGGKTYGASSSFDRNSDKGSFVVSTFTRNSEAVATTKLLIDEIAKMAKDGPTQDEVAAAIANIAGGYGLRFQAASDVGAALIGAELHDFGLEYLQNYPVQVGKVDVASAKQAASEILDPHDYVIVMVGDAKDLEPQLKKEGWRYEVVSFTDPISPEPKEEATVDPKASAAAKKLLDEAIAAKGGKKYTALKAFRWTASGTTTIQGRQIPVDIVRTIVAPDKMRIDATLAKQANVVVALDGRTGWQQQPDQKGGSDTLDLKEDEFGTLDFERWREPELILQKAAAPTARITAAPDETIDGKPQGVIRLGSPFQGLEVSIDIDRKTKMITRMSFSDGAQTETDDFDDYKPSGGIQVAHHWKQSVAGRVTDLTVSTFEIDPKIDPNLYKKPAAEKK